MYEEDIKYLKDDKISKIISQGLAETYIAQPKYPVEFMAKWLLKHCEMVRVKDKEEEFKSLLAAEQQSYLITEYSKKMEVDRLLTEQQAAQSFRAEVFKQLRNVD
jgi:hypothetical protein